MTDDGKDYSYVSDAFGRLKRVKNRGSSAVVAEYTYNGLNMRIDWHTSYGIPLRIDPGDYNRDGYVNGDDLDDYGDDFDNTRTEADVDFDGDVDEDDYDLFSAWWDAPSTAGRFTLSASSVANRIGYAGYQYDPTFVGASRAIYHVRNRVYDAGLGRWLRRDPAGYVDGVSLYIYAQSSPNEWTDPEGLATSDCSKDLPHIECPGAAMAACESKIDYWKERNKSKKIIDAYKACTNGTEPSISCCCRGCDWMCSDPSYAAVTHPRTGSICICVPLLVPDRFQEFLVHELVHAYDIGCRKKDTTSCDGAVCTEIRAYDYGGTCAGKKGQAHKDCIVASAAASAKAQCGGEEKAAEKARELYYQCIGTAKDDFEKPRPRPTPAPGGGSTGGGGSVSPMQW